MELRPYQREAVEAVYKFLRARNDNPCVVIPTAGGKTPVMAAICRDAVRRWSGRVLILAHVRELLEQAAENLRTVAPDLPVGIYSAGLKRRDLGYAVTIAGIQSVYERASDIGHVDLVFVDEAHLIPPDGEGMYRTFLADAKKVNPHLRVIGLTATPFRMKSGMICAPENILNAVCFDVGVRELIVQGYLCPLMSKAGRDKADMSNLHVRAGEFITGEVEALMNEDRLVTSACQEILNYAHNRKACLIFTSGIKHGTHVAETLRRMGVHVETVFGDTLDFERDRILNEFRAGTLHYLVNVNVLTTGFDAPNIDCVAMLRPTLSPGLYYQMVGRGFRLCQGKENCLILDFGGNILRHGPVDQLCVSSNESNGTGKAPAKECPQCHTVMAAGYTICPDCSYEFLERDRHKHDARATSMDILSGDVTVETYPVQEVTYAIHTKRDALPDAPRTMRVTYQIGFNDWQSEWICFEHTGYARYKAELWWRKRSNNPVPQSVEVAVGLAECGALAPTHHIVIEQKSGEKYAHIIGYQLGEKPAKAMITPSLENDCDHGNCPRCGKSERTLQPGTGPHAGQEVCTWCSSWLRWVPKNEYEARMAVEVPF